MGSRGIIKLANKIIRRIPYMLRNTSCEQPDFLQYIEYHRIPKNHILLRAAPHFFSYLSSVFLKKQKSTEALLPL